MTSNRCPHLATLPQPTRHSIPSRPWNPLSDDDAVRSDSSYLGLEGEHLQNRLNPFHSVTAQESSVHDGLVSTVLANSFPCVAARSTFNRRGYRFGLYPQLATQRSARALCHDLYEFAHEFPDASDQFHTFMAVFPSTTAGSEADFEKMLWQQLQLMHEVDAEHFDWSPAVSSDPEDAKFSYSIGRRAFFVVGLSPVASRRARVTPWPVLVFNPHDQFERLREAGKYDGLQAAIRARDLKLQGTINPVLTNFGERSETRQYSGRPVSEEWRCPFHNVRHGEEARQ
jgi:FPC/CPF motif-containing protein YcgG